MATRTPSHMSATAHRCTRRSAVIASSATGTPMTIVKASATTPRIIVSSPIRGGDYRQAGTPLAPMRPSPYVRATFASGLVRPCVMGYAAASVHGSAARSPETSPTFFRYFGEAGPQRAMTRSPSQAAAGRFVFGEFLLDVAGHRLWREAREIPLPPQSWGVLCYLPARPGLLVTKETLHGEIWRGSVVSDDTLTKSIAELRQALGDNTRSPRFIETVHGRGFRFVAEVRPASGVDAQPPTTTFPVAEAGLTFV